MPEPPRRKRFQIHLSTAIALMFIAGGLIWANVSGRRVECLGTAWRQHAGDDDKQVYFQITESEFLISHYDFWGGGRMIEHGWPFNTLNTNSFVYISRSGVLEPPERAADVWRTGPLIYNALIALSILFAVYFLLELRIRRAARKGA